MKAITSLTKPQTTKDFIQTSNMSGRKKCFFDGHSKH